MLPSYPIRSTGLLSLLSASSEVEASEYGPSVAHTLASEDDGAPSLSHSGEILGLTLISSESGTGAIQKPACKLFVLTANPATAAGDAALVIAEHRQVLAIVPIAAADWVEDAAGAVVTKQVAIPFEAIAVLAFVLKLDAGATTINSDPAEDELLQLVARYRLDS